MNKIQLSQITNWWKFSTEQIIDYMIDKKYDTLINDLGYGIEFSLDDLITMWEFLKKFKKQS